MIELIVEDIDGNRINLDVKQDEVIVLRQEFVELTNIEKRKGSYTQTFSLPPTTINDLFFGQFGDPSHFGGEWTPRIDAPAWLLEDTNLVIQGSLKLESTNSNNDRYNISISSVLFTLKRLLGDSLLSDLDMAAWSVTPAQVQDTWDGSFQGGHLIYSVHDFGQGYGLYVKEGDPSVLTLQNIKDNATPIRLFNTLPTFRLNELLRMIFNEQQLSIEGQWFDEVDSELIYVQSDNPLADFVQSISSLSVWLEQNFFVETTAVLILPMVADPTDPNWNDTTNQYTAPSDGDYFWDITWVHFQGSPAGRTIEMDLYKNNIFESNIFSQTWGGGATINNFRVTLVAGDFIDFRVHLTANASQPGSVRGARQTFVKLAFYLSTSPATDPSRYLSNHTQIGFLRAITQIFNLILWTDPDGNFRLDPYDYFQATFGTQKDWTDKIDQTSFPTVKPINRELRNPINISLKKAGDVLNKSFIEVTGRTYGNYWEDSLMPFGLPPAADIGIFAPSPTQSIISVTAAANFDDFVIAKLYEDSESVSYKPPGLQLYYYNGMRNPGTTFYTQNDPGGGFTPRTEYPYFSNFRLFSGDAWQVQSDSLDLNFTYWTPATNIVDDPTDQGLYNRYFREMLRERYDFGNKILELKVLLDGVDMSTFSFADTIIINLNGTPVGLQILDIKDYSPANKRLTSVKAMITYIR